MHHSLRRRYIDLCQFKDSSFATCWSGVLGKQPGYVGNPRASVNRRETWSHKVESSTPLYYWRRQIPKAKTINHAVLTSTPPPLPLVNSEVRVAQLILFYLLFCGSLFDLLSIVLSVLRVTDSDYPFGIFKLFLIINRISFLKSGVIHGNIFYIKIEWTLIHCFRWYLTLLNNNS